MDPGASFFLMGIGPLTRYLEHLGKLGFPINQIKFNKADRTFHFGGDHKAVSNWTVHLPIYLNNKFRLVQAVVLRGETPMLLGRPIDKAFGLTVDFLNHRLRCNDGEWRAATLGRHMEYLLPLTEGYDPSIGINNPEFDLVLEDEKGPGFSLDEFKEPEEIYVTEDVVIPEGSNVLKTKQLKPLDTSVLTRLNAAEAYISQTLRDMDLRQPRQLWEVYCGESRVTKIATSLGMDVQHFGLNNVWNFSSSQSASAVLQAHLLETGQRRPTCLLGATFAGFVMAHQRAVNFARSPSPCQVQPMPIWRNVQERRRAMAASPTGHNPLDYEASRGPSYESTLPW